mgnify:CR=1 FL=1
MNKIKQLYLIASELGIRYVVFRAYFELKRKTGLLKRQFPTSIKMKSPIAFDEWKALKVPFFLDGRESLKFPLDTNVELKERYAKIRRGEVCFFHHEWKMMGLNYDWLTNPDSGHTYSLDHWTQIPSYDKSIGDIKYIWEKSRFCYVQDIIRYDYHFEQDSSAFVLDEILDWIDKNPLNQGPNYICSQEISLRLLNWTLALQFYKNTIDLSESNFSKIIESVYGQILHVEKNLNFSRYLVRNNHAITECFLLYLAGQVYPFFKEANYLKKKGKRLLDKELLYQIYEDGSYIQHSHNYHRVTIQMATWYLQTAKTAKDSIKPRVIERLEKTSTFLLNHRQKGGQLPNYGANDGALFFNLSNTEYSNFSPQIAAFRAALGLPINYTEVGEDIHWYGLKAKIDTAILAPIFKAETTGYYVLRKGDLTVCIRCGDHPDRPSQADNLHLDIWKDGKNIFWDSGSYKYNTTKENISHFWGTSGHNTLQLDDKDQMLKGDRFLWHYWTTSLGDIIIEEQDNSIRFEGEISAYRHIHKKIRHRRNVVLFENKIEIVDTLKPKPNHSQIYQNWHVNPEFLDSVRIETSGDMTTETSVMSRFYGVKSESILKKSMSPSNSITTTIYLK